MAIAFVNSSTAQNNAGASTLVVNVPAGVANGHVMWLLVAQNNTTTTLAAITGWTDVPGPTWPISDSNSRIWVRYRVASSEPASYTCDWGAGTPKSIGTIIAYSGVDTTTPHDANAQATNETGVGTTHTTPNITTVTADAWLLSFFADRSGTGNTWTPPSGDTERVDATVSGTSQCSCEIADTNAGVTVGTYSKTATPSAAQADATMAIIAIRPAATGDATVTAVMATATADALVPTVTADSSITAVQATATADGIVPTVTADSTVAAVQATATADALVPAISADALVTAVLATATADALVPAVSGNSPDATVTVPAPADATAVALAPTVSVVAPIVWASGTVGLTSASGMVTQDGASGTTRHELTDPTPAGVSAASGTTTHQSASSGEAGVT